MVSSGIMHGKVPNQPKYTSKACKKAQGLRLAKELVLRPHETSSKEPRTTKPVLDHAKGSLKQARAKVKTSQNEGPKARCK